MTGGMSFYLNAGRLTAMAQHKYLAMENAAAISDIKQGNWADVIYSVTDGKNAAKSIIVEKEEEAPAEMPKAEPMPQEAPKQQ